MNTYEITFTRENGSTGKDRITAANEKQARKDFREIHRHSSATITDVIVAAENVPASKQQERDALDQIRAIVDTLGPDSYGTCTVTIFLLTVDQYRRNRDVIPNADDWWWLSTAFSTKSNGYESLARDVSADGTLDGNIACDGRLGLRPACYLDSDLLISVEDDEATDDVTPEHAGEIIAALAEQFGGTFATEDQLTTALSFMLGTLRATREKEARHE